MDRTKLMNWNLNLSLLILLSFSLATWLFIGKAGIKHVLVYTIFSVSIYIKQDLFLLAVPTLLFFIFCLSIPKIERMLPLILSFMLVLMSTIVSIAALAYPPFDIFLIRDLTSITSVLVGILFLLPSCRDYALALTFILFATFFYSYANQYSPFVRVSLPFACLSLVPYLCITVINNYTEGSIAYKLQLRILRAIAVRLKIEDKSKYTTLALAIMKL